VRILLGTNHLWSYTGSELNLVGLARAMAARQHHPVATILRSRLPTHPLLLAHLGVEPEIDRAPLQEFGASAYLTARHPRLWRVVRWLLIGQDSRS